MKPLLDLSQQVALVIGSSRGIGKAVAKKIAQQGAHVVVTYHSGQDEAEAVVAEIKEDQGEAVAFPCDAGRISSVREVFRKTIDHYGKPDIVVIVTAGKITYKPTAQLTEEEYDAMFEVVKGSYFALQEAAQHIANEGRIVCFSSGATQMPRPASGAYAGAKAAIEQFCRGLMKELGEKKVRVNLVAPGPTDTDGLKAPQEAIDQLIDQTPLGRLGQPGDVADAVLLLLSKEAYWINGQVVGVNGGIL